MESLLRFDAIIAAAGQCLEMTQLKFVHIFPQVQPKDEMNNLLLLAPLPTLPTGPSSKGNLALPQLLVLILHHCRLVRSPLYETAQEWEWDVLVRIQMLTLEKLSLSPFT